MSEAIAGDPNGGGGTGGGDPAARAGAVKPGEVLDDKSAPGAGSAAPKTIDAGDDDKPLSRKEVKALMGDILKEHSSATATSLAKQNAVALARQNFITKEMSGVPQAYWEKLPHTDDPKALREAGAGIIDQLNHDMNDFFKRFPRGEEARKILFPNIGGGNSGSPPSAPQRDTSNLSPEQKIATGMRPPIGTGREIPVAVKHDLNAH